MPVSLWAVLGLVLLLIGLPVVIFLPPGAGGFFGYMVGAGAAFLVVAVSQAIWESWPEPEAETADTKPKEEQH